MKRNKPMIITKCGKHPFSRVSPFYFSPQTIKLDMKRNLRFTFGITKILTSTAMQVTVKVYVTNITAIMMKIRVRQILFNIKRSKLVMDRNLKFTLCTFGITKIQTFSAL